MVFLRDAGEVCLSYRSARRHRALPKAAGDRTHPHRIETWDDEGNDRPYAVVNKTRQGRGDRRGCQAGLRGTLGGRLRRWRRLEHIRDAEDPTCTDGPSCREIPGRDRNGLRHRGASERPHPLLEWQRRDVHEQQAAGAEGKAAWLDERADAGSLARHFVFEGQDREAPRSDQPREGGRGPGGLRKALRGVDIVQEDAGRLIRLGPGALMPSTGISFHEYSMGIG